MPEFTLTARIFLMIRLELLLDCNINSYQCILVGCSLKSSFRRAKELTEKLRVRVTWRLVSFYPESLLEKAERGRLGLCGDVPLPFCPAPLGEDGHRKVSASPGTASEGEPER